MKIRKTPADHAFNAVNYLIMTIVLIVTLYPFWYVTCGSVSSMAHLIKNGFILWPDGLHLDAYEQVFRNDLVPVAYRNTLIVTVGGTAVSMLLTILGGFALSLRKLPGRGVLTFFFVFTMMFGGGLVPTFLVVSSLGMIDTLWALIIPGAISTYNMILLRNFFQSVPESLYEAASIDGESLPGYVFHILLPPSGGAGDDYALLRRGLLERLFQQYHLHPQQPPLAHADRSAPGAADRADEQHDVRRREEGRRARNDEGRDDRGDPILCVYPFVQKYFVKGVMVGSLKG